jgi:hypothetical protein
LFIGLQWYEMKTGSGDTHNLASAAASQAEALKLQEQQMETMAQAAKTQAVGVVESAEAAKSAANSAVAALRIEEPFLSVESITPYNFPDGANPGFIVSFRNTGRMLAADVMGNTTLTLTRGSVTPQRILLPLDPGGNFRLPDIAAGAAPATRWIAVSDQADFAKNREDIKSGKTRFYVRGFITWKNSEGISYPERTFCGFYNPDPHRPPAGVGQLDICPSDQ